MKKFLALVLMAMSISAYAAQSTVVDLSKLSPEARQAVMQQVNELEKSPTNISATVRKEAEAWGDLGANMGKAMVGAAKEVGVAANEFSQTPLGQVVVFLAAYKIVGQDVLGVIVGSLIMLVGYSLAIWLFTTKRWSTVKYEYEPVMWGMYKKARMVEIKTADDVVTGKILSGLTLLALSTIVGLSTIF